MFVDPSETVCAISTLLSTSLALLAAVLNVDLKISIFDKFLRRLLHAPLCEQMIDTDATRQYPNREVADAVFVNFSLLAFRLKPHVQTCVEA